MARVARRVIKEWRFPLVPPESYEGGNRRPWAMWALRSQSRERAGRKVPLGPEWKTGKQTLNHAPGTITGTYVPVIEGFLDVPIVGNSPARLNALWAW